MAISPYVYKLNDTRRIVTPQVSGSTSIDPYFLRPYTAAWNGGNVGNRGLTWQYYEGEWQLLALGGDVRTNQSNALLSIPGGGNYLGFIVTLEGIPEGAKVQIFVAGHNYAADIYRDGRYHGKILLDQAATVIYAWCHWQAGDVEGTIKVKELFFFDAGKYTYEDFLQSPNAILQYEGKDTRATISRVLPRLGFVDSALNELVSTGRWLGNQLRYSEDLSQVTYWHAGGATITQNATTAPDGTNTADKILSVSAGRVYQDAPLSDNLATGNKTFSVWVKSVSGNTPFKLRVKQAFGETVNELDQICGLQWNRFFITGEVTTQGCTAEIEVTSATGIYVWGMQVVDTDSEPGAYTKTTSAILPPGTKPSGAPTFDIPNIEGRVGDRLENLSWDGKFATPIAWICTAPGNPGTWKEVYLFDA